MQFYYTYAIHSLGDSKFYIGYTNNLKRRLTEHHNKKVRSTKKKKQLKLIYYEAYLNKYDALKREEYLKSGWGFRSIKKMLKNYLEGCRSG